MLLKFLLDHLPIISLVATAMISVPGLENTSGPVVEGGSDVGEDTRTVETSDGSTSSDADTDTVTDSEGDKSELKIDWTKIPSEVKSHIQDIAKANPKLSNLLQNAVYTSQSFLKEIPGGLKEIRALRASIEEAGGIDEIKNMAGLHKQLVDEQEVMDNQARNGDPAILDNLINIAGEGFSKLMPTAMSRWESSDPQGYQHQMSKLIVGAMKEGGFVADLNMAFSMLKLNTPEATKEAINCLTRVANWANGMNQLAVRAPVKPTIDPKIQVEQQKLDDQRARLFNQEFSNEFSNWRNKEIIREVGKISNGRQLTDYQMSTLGGKIVEEVGNILTSDEDYMKNLKRIYDTFDKAELLKFTRARTAKLLPDITKKAYRSLFSNPGKPGPKVVVKTNGAQPETSVVKGWQKIDPSKAPDPSLIDGKKTSFEMKYRKQAILTDGRKVYWGSTVPTS
jgi:hypothetical protein